MADRFLFKKFASETNDVGQFGSFQSTGGKVGDGVKTTDPDLIQSLPAWKAGWGNAVDNGLLLPRLEEMNGVQRVFAEMLWNQWRDGVTFWQAGAPVKALQSIVMYQTGDEFPKWYIKITGTSTTTPPDSDTTNWYMFLDTGKSYANVDLSNLSAAGQAKFDAKANIDLSNVNNTGNAAASNLNSKGIRTVVETYVNGTSWYRLFSDGFIEQGGSQMVPYGTTTITLLFPANILNASGIRSTMNHTTPESNPMIGILNEGEQIKINTGSGSSEYFFWKVEGYKK